MDGDPLDTGKRRDHGVHGTRTAARWTREDGAGVESAMVVQSWKANQSSTGHGNYHLGANLLHMWQADPGDGESDHGVTRI